MLGVACASQHDSETAAPTPASLVSPVMRDGIVYTPVSVGSHGCVLYSVQIPGGQAPAALAYQSTDGQFSYGRPEMCVKKVGVP